MVIKLKMQSLSVKHANIDQQRVEKILKEFKLEEHKDMKLRFVQCQFKRGAFSLLSDAINRRSGRVSKNVASVT